MHGEADAAATRRDLAQARHLAASGADDAARAAYLDLLRTQPTLCPALVELGALALAGGYRSAARTAWQQAALHHPHNAVAQAALAILLLEDGEVAAARVHLDRALAADPACRPAHEAMAQLLEAEGDPAAAALARHRGFAGHATSRRRYRGPGDGIGLLLLVCARGGNVPVRRWIDDRRYAVTTLCPEYHPEGSPLPPHALVVNAIGDADLGGVALACAERLLADNRTPVINQPAHVRRTTRLHNAGSLAAVPGVVTPRMLCLPRARIAAAGVLGFPLLLRVPGLHTGRHFIEVTSGAGLAKAAASLPGDELLAIERLDARRPDGLWHKYRVMLIGGKLYPLHLALSRHWKVHYFTAAMAEDACYREEERRFLSDMQGCLGVRAMTALRGIAAQLGLDYAGIDFAIDAGGSVLLFEANATMAIHPPDPDPRWHYRRPAVAEAVAAATRMLRTFEGTD